MPRLNPRLIATMLVPALLCACSTTESAPAAKDVAAAASDRQAPLRAIAGDLEGTLRRAQALRQAGKFDEAVQLLSQATLVAADDARVVGEYGKTLAQMGRADDATSFLRRAVELSPGDWSLYSALGVAYDQAGDSAHARAAYERALSLRPGEPAVLNNLALSRLLAKDPEGARQFIAQAQSAGQPDDAKIARNVALINRLAPAPQAAAPHPVQAASNTKTTPAPVAVARVQPPIPVVETQPASQTPRDAGDVARRLAAQGPQIAAAQVAVGAPRALMPTQQAAAAPQSIDPPLPPLPQRTATSGTVVMQAVPFDPLAGPVKAKPKPRPMAAAKKPVQQAQVPSLRVANEQY